MIGRIRLLGRTRSTLFSTQKTGPEYARSGSRTISSGSSLTEASTTRQTRSTSSTARRAVFSMKSPSMPAAGRSPGVSTKTTCAPARFLMPVIRFRVVCGRGDTIESFSPTRRFKSVDFPALGRPMSDTKPARLVTVAEPLSPAPTEGGLRQTRPGSVVAEPVSPAPTEGGLRQTRPGSVVAEPVNPAPTGGGLRQTRPGSVVAEPVSPAPTGGGLRQTRPGSVVAEPVSPAPTGGGLRQTRPGS